MNSNPTRPGSQNSNPELEEMYQDTIIDDEEIDLDEDIDTSDNMLTYGLAELKKMRKIPLGKIIYNNKPFFMDYPELTEKTYNVFTYVSSMGTGKSTNVRSMIYYTTTFDPDTVTIIFDPMRMEYASLNIKPQTEEEIEEKKKGLLNDTFIGEDNVPMQIEIEPGTVPVFHLIPRFALKKREWDQEELMYVDTYDETTLSLLRKDGGFVYAEDASRMSENQLFNALNFRELKQNQAIHFYLRQGIRICNNRFGRGNWFIGDLVETLREGVKNILDAKEVEDLEDSSDVDKKTGLSNNELQLIEQIEKYNDVGFFVKNKSERKRYSTDFRKFIRIGKIINISFLGFMKTEKLGEDLVVGQTDLFLERLIEISNEYYDAIRKKKVGTELTDWENYLLKRWKVSMWFEESEIFTPRDCNKSDVKKWPCIKRIDYLMSFGRKYGFKNFGFITQRIKKVNPIIFEESNNIFIGSLIGEERDRILADFGVNKLKFPINGQEVTIRDIVNTLKKEKHQWVYISKHMNSVAPIGTYDSPCG